MALGGIRSGVVPWGELLPFVVRPNSLSASLKLSPRVVGTNVQNSAFARHFSFQRQRYQLHLVVCSLCVGSMPF